MGVARGGVGGVKWRWVARSGVGGAKWSEVGWAAQCGGGQREVGAGGMQWVGVKWVAQSGGARWGVWQCKVEVGGLPSQRKFSEPQIWPWESDYIRGAGSRCRLPYSCNLEASFTGSSHSELCLNNGNFPLTATPVKQSFVSWRFLLWSHWWAWLRVTMAGSPPAPNGTQFSALTPL